MNNDYGVGRSLHKSPISNWQIARSVRFGKSSLTCPKDVSSLTYPAFHEIRLCFEDKYVHSGLYEKVIAGDIFPTLENHTGSSWAIVP